MKKLFLRFFLIIATLIASALIYLSFFGLETNKFDNVIKKQANKINQHVKLDFNKIKIYLNIKDLDFLVKLKNSKIIIKYDTIKIQKLNLFLPIKSFYNKNFMLRKVNIGFKKNDIKDLTKVTSIFLPRFVNKKLNNIFIQGNLEGEFEIPFDNNGRVKKDYTFSGKVLDATIKLTEEFIIKNLTTDINYGHDLKNNKFEALIKNGSIYKLNLAGSSILLKRKKNIFEIKSILFTDGKLNFKEIKKLASLFRLNVNNIEHINGDVNLKTEINFNINESYKVEDLLYLTEGNLRLLEVNTPKINKIKDYIPSINSNITIKNTNIRVNKSISNQSVELSGLVKLSENFDNFKIKEEFNYKKKLFNIIGNIALTNSTIKLEKINYTKNIGKDSKVDFNINFALDKFYKVNKLDFLEENNTISISNLELNKKFEIDDFEKISIKTFLNNKKNNDFLIKKKKQIIISGDLFDAQPLLKSLYKKGKKDTFDNKFNSELKINFKKVLTGTNDNVFNFVTIASIKNGSFVKLVLKGNFSNNEIVEMSIYQLDKDKKTLQVISDRARPFIKNFDFIEGFRGGKLEYDSTISKNVSNSNLKIKDFKVSKVPALAKLLTLASLQGIADTLSGEGIRFDSFEMKSNSVGNVLNIEDALAMGPAISILLDGYVDKGNIVSLRGTLVPATRLNAFIAKIPLVGDILVGQKTGEGVVGVSFKMKGHPKDIKTSVNPIKTLTPRFIVRAVEKIKKKNKEKAK